MPEWWNADTYGLSPYAHSGVRVQIPPPVPNIILDIMPNSEYAIIMRADIDQRKDEILQWIKERLPKSVMCERLNCRPDTLNRRFKKWGVLYKGNQGSEGYVRSNRRLSALEYICTSSHIHAHELRKKLIEDGVKEHKCETCGCTEWTGKPIPLELHHIDGNRFNNALVNLIILCPNCHAFTDNYRGRGIKRQPRKKKSTGLYCTECNKEISKKSKSGKCRDCIPRGLRRVKWPTKEELGDLVWSMPLNRIARKYGVSDTTIGKWCRHYGVSKPPTGYWLKSN